MTTLLKRWGVFAVLAALTGCGADDSPSEPGPSTTQDSGVDAPAPGPKIWVSADALDAGVLSCELSGANADARYQALKLVVRNDGDAVLFEDPVDLLFLAPDDIPIFVPALLPFAVLEGLVNAVFKGGLEFDVGPESKGIYGGLG